MNGASALWQEAEEKEEEGCDEGTTVITEKTKIYCSESQEVSVGPSIKGKLQENEDYKVNVSGL